MNGPDAPRSAPAASADRDSCSVCIITFNEAANLEPCLESVRWADEIIVVDSGSQDATVAIARRFTDRVIVREWPGHVAQKNFAAEQARCGWILSLDADERVTPRLREEIQAVLRGRGDGPVGYRFPRRNFYLGRWWTRGGWYPDLKLRLWRRGHGRWSGEDPHDHVEVSGPSGRLRGELLHFSFRSVADHVARMNSYSSIASLAKRDRNLPFRRSDLILRPPWRFFRMFVVQGGGRDGIAGLAVAGVESFYVFLKYLKLWEIRALLGGEPLPPPSPEGKPSGRSGERRVVPGGGSFLSGGSGPGHGPG